MSRFELIYHRDVVDELERLPEVLSGKMLRLLETLAEQGNNLRFPQSRPLRQGLFELRAPGNDTARTLFIFHCRRQIFILRCFIKKTEKTPTSEIKLALRRFEEMTDAEG